MSTNFPDRAGPIGQRFIDRPRPGAGSEGPEDRAAALLRQLREPPPLGGAALARIAARLEGAEHHRLGVARRWPLWLVPVLGGGVALLALALRPASPVSAPVEDPTAPLASRSSPVPPSAPGRELPTVAGGALERLSAGDAALVLQGPAAAMVDGVTPVSLRRGRLLVRGGGAPLTVIPGGLVGVRPGAVVEIVVRERGGLRVAAYVGGATVERDGATLVEVTADFALSEGVLAPAGAAGRAEAERLLDGPQDPPRPRAALPVSPPAVRGATALAPGAGSAEPPVPAAEPATTETALAAESRLVGDVLGRLRARDGAGALALLEDHQARFPRGTLNEEAQEARVQALLLLGRRGPALGELDRMPLAGLARGAELRVLRGELRAEAGRCADALADFGATLASGPAAPSAALEERARYGRATCRARAGDAEGARGDLREYLQRFPGGRFSDAAREALGR